MAAAAAEVFSSVLREVCIVSSLSNRRCLERLVCFSAKY
jgi:hypothetical protein